MNARPTAKQIAQTAVLNGHLIPAGGPKLVEFKLTDYMKPASFDINGTYYINCGKVKLPSEAGIQRTDAPKSPRRYVKRKPNLPLTPVTKNGKHLFIIYPK